MSASQPRTDDAVLLLVTTIGWVAVATVWFVIVGAVTTVLFNLVYSNVLPMIPAAALSAGVLGGFFWWLLVERGFVTYLRGFTVGGLTGLLAIPFMWFIIILFISGLRITGIRDLGQIVAGSLFFGTVGFFLAGWLTLTLGCLSAVLLTAIRLRFPH